MRDYRKLASGRYGQCGIIGDSAGNIALRRNDGCRWVGQRGQTGSLQHGGRDDAAPAIRQVSRSSGGYDGGGIPPSSRRSGHFDLPLVLSLSKDQDRLQPR